MADQLLEPRITLTSLFSQLDAQSTLDPNRAPSTNPLRDLGPNVQRLFITLHCLFPNEFLSALDLLDRRLVTRLACPLDAHAAKTEEAAGPSKVENYVYYVASAQPTGRWRHHPASTGTSYEVRLRSWNCSCPAFVFAAFSNASFEPQRGDDEGLSWLPNFTEEKAFGGCTLGDDTSPVCKHLLACYMAEKCSRLFGGYYTKTNASREEIMGWAAGWGDR